MNIRGTWAWGIPQGLIKDRIFQQVCRKTGQVKIMFALIVVKLSGEIASSHLAGRIFPFLRMLLVGGIGMCVRLRSAFRRQPGALDFAAEVVGCLFEVEEFPSSFFQRG
jgi:hypothetical protein